MKEASRYFNCNGYSFLMKISKRTKVIFFSLILITFFQQKVLSDDRPESPFYDSFELLLRDFKNDVKEFDEKVQSSILLNIYLENGISPSFKYHVRRSFEAMKVEKSSFFFKHCAACTVKRGDTIGKQVYFKKGFKNLKTIQEITKKRNVNSYGEVRIIKNRLSLELKVSFYSAKNGGKIWSKTYKNKMIKIGNLNFTSSIFFRFGWEWGGPILISFSLGEKIYGIGDVDLNFTLGTPTEVKNENGSQVENKNTTSVNTYISFGPQVTLDINRIFKFRSNWGNHLIYSEVGFCIYERYKMDSELRDPEGTWGYNLSFGYGANIKDIVTITIGFVKGFFFNSGDDFQRYPWIINSGFGFRF